MVKNFLRNHLGNANSLLVIITFALAIAIPFELFLFSYVFIGPIHYLSEIAWLDKKPILLTLKSNAIFLFF